MNLRFWRKKYVTDKQTDIGSVLTRMGLVTEEQLAEAVEQQQRGEEVMLGAILVGRGLITEDDLAAALDLQRRMRKGDAADAMLEIMEKRTDKARASLHLVEVKP